MTQTGILVVEDDHFVLKFLKQVMPEFVQGHLHFAKSAEDALEIWREHKDTIEVLFTDLSLPGMSGEELVATLAGEKPTLRTIISTGRPVSQRQLEDTLHSKITLVEKPFQPTVFLDLFSPARELVAA